MEIVEEDSLHWDQNEYTIGEVVENFVLPQAIKIVCGYDDGHQGVALEREQILIIHEVRKVQTVKAKNLKCEDIFIPSNCPQKVELRPSEWLNELFTVKELSSIFPKYRFARVKQGLYSPTKERHLNTGDKLEIKKITRRGEVLICNNQDKDKLCLPVDLEAGFEALFDSGEYLIDDLIRSREFPLYAQFIDFQFKQIENSCFYDSILGVLKLENVFQVDELVCSSKSDDGKRLILKVPKEIGILVMVADDQFEQNKKYLQLSKSLDIDGHLATVEELNLHNYFVSPSRIREYRGAELDTRVFATASAEEQQFPPPLPPRSPNRPARKKDKSAKRSMKANSKELHEEVQVLRASKSEANNVKELAKNVHNIISDLPQVASGNVGVQGQYISTAISHCKSKNAEGKNLDLYETIPDCHTTLNFNKMDAVKSIADLGHSQLSLKSKYDSRVSTSFPSLLPSVEHDAQNLLSHSPSESSAVSQQTRTSQSSIHDLSDLTISEVANFLRVHRLEGLVEIFEREQIDGRMLLVLDQDEMRALGMNSFQIKKLMMLIEGWRPRE